MSKTISDEMNAEQLRQQQAEAQMKAASEQAHDPAITQILEHNNQRLAVLSEFIVRLSKRMSQLNHVVQMDQMAQQAQLKATRQLIATLAVTTSIILLGVAGLGVFIYFTFGANGQLRMSRLPVKPVAFDVADPKPIQAEPIQDMLDRILGSQASEMLPPVEEFDAEVNQQEVVVPIQWNPEQPQQTWGPSLFAIESAPTVFTQKPEISKNPEEEEITVPSKALTEDEWDALDELHAFDELTEGLEPIGVPVPMQGERVTVGQVVSRQTAEKINFEIPLSLKKSEPLPEQALEPPQRSPSPGSTVDKGGPVWSGRLSPRSH